MAFSHLSVHSHYSLLAALPQIDPLVDAAVAFGMPAMALTDRNNLYGAIEFYKAATKKGLKPIFGVDIDYNLGGAEGHVILLAENKDGYQNLIRLVSAANMTAVPKMRSEDLLKFGTGLVALIPDTALIAQSAEALVEELQKAVGKANVYARLGWNGGKERQLRTAGVAKALGLELVASDGTYYLMPEDRQPLDIVRRIQNPSAEADGNDRAFASPTTLEDRYHEFPEAVKNMEALVERCTVVLELGNWIFPKFAIPEGTTYDAELRKAAMSGIARRGLTETPEVLERIEYELGIISSKGFSPYFLTVSDLLAYARNTRILTTTRGSAAGSLVSYLSGITNVNPLEYKLPFERFLNPGRPKAPDIDMDIADNKRDLMVEYVKRKYGADHVAQIGTFGTMMARAAVRDVARALGYSYGIGDRIAKLIPIGSQGFPMTIEHALEIEEDLRKLYKSDEDAEIIINTARKIEGNSRHISVHAAGVVVAPSPITDYTPIQLDPHGEKIITQYDMYSLTDEYGGVGLLKFDFLGLKNLAVLADAVDRVDRRMGQTVDIETVPVDDPKTFDMLAKGFTEGVFQLSGGGMTRYLKDLKPTSIHDINAMVALYRPGPMEMIPQYIQRKYNPAYITYLDPRMKDILDRSYGIITYQDDVLMTAITIAGYSWLEADNLRKAMGKKIPAEMEAQKEKFLAGAESYGKISRNKAEAIWKLIEPFAAYGFNKAHAASYGKVAYQTAYMKANFAEDYMSALMSADSGDVDSISSHVAESERLGITVLPPDVNESYKSFSVPKPGVIRFGLHTIKNFGEGAARAIIDERQRNGEFVSLGDFASRIPTTAINKRAMESLIKAGALDRYGERAAMIAKLDEISRAQHKDETHENQNALFAVSSSTPNIMLGPEVTTLKDKLEWEKELLGIYVSGHPTDQFKDAMEKYKGSVRRAVLEERPGYPMVIGGVVEIAKIILTKKGERMGFLTIADKEASIEAVAFPSVYKDNKDALLEGKTVLLKGKVNRRNGDPSLIIDKVKALG
ncbi:MAG: DNA polymerase III subunit alpha [Patescibacteria group bacterium]